MEPTAQHVTGISTNLQEHHQANVVIEPTTGASIEYKHIIKGPNKVIRVNSFANEIVQLAQGVGARISSGTNTILFISKDKVPSARTVTYGIIVAETRLQKSETHHTILKVGGNLIDFHGDVTIPTEDIIMVKLIFNSVLSTKNV